MRPDFEKARYNLGIALRAQGQTGKAQKELNEVEGLHQFRTHLAESKQLILEGVEALKQQRLTEAADRFQKSVDDAQGCRLGITIWASR